MAYNTAYLDELVAEYLTYRGFFASLKAFKQEQKTDKSKSFNVDRIVDFLLQLTSSGDLQLLRATWSHLNNAIFSRLPDSIHASAAQRIEIALYKLYLVHASQSGKRDKIVEFFQAMGATLISNSDSAAWKDWLAFPYVAQPQSQPPFAICFTRPWQDSVTISLTNLLMIAFNLLPKPRLVAMIEHLVKVENELNRTRESNGSGYFKDSADASLHVGSSSRQSLAMEASQILPSNTNEPLRPSRRLLSFFMSNKNSSPASSNNSPQVAQPSQSGDFRRSKSQSSFIRQSQLFNASGLSDIPMPENPMEIDYNNRLGIESETDDIVVISNKTNGNNVNNGKNTDNEASETSDMSAAEDAFEVRGEISDSAEISNRLSTDRQSNGDNQDDADSSATPKASGSASISQSLPAQSFMDKIMNSFQQTPTVPKIASHRKHASATRFTCLDIERVEVPGCHGEAIIRYSTDGRFLAVLSQSAQSVFLFSADAITNRGVISSALVPSPPSSFCIGASRVSPSSDDISQVIVAVGITSAAKLFVFTQPDASTKLSGKILMSTNQILLVPIELHTTGKQYCVSAVEAIPNQLDMAICAVSTTDGSQIFSHLCIVSLTDLVVVKRVEASLVIPSPISSISCLPMQDNPTSWILVCADTSGSVHVSRGTSPISPNLNLTWNSIKIQSFGKITSVQGIPENKLLVSDSSGRFSIIRIENPSSRENMTLRQLSECDAFCSTVAACPSASPDGQFAAVLFDKGSSLFLVNVSSTDFGEIVAQLSASGEGERDSTAGTQPQSSDFTSVAWTPSVLHSAFTYVAGLTISGDLLVFRLLT